MLVPWAFHSRTSPRHKNRCGGYPLRRALLRLAASGLRNSEPIPDETASGSAPNMAVSIVIMMERKRSIGRKARTRRLW